MPVVTQNNDGSPYDNRDERRNSTGLHSPLWVANWSSRTWGVVIGVAILLVVAFYW